MKRTRLPRPESKELRRLVPNAAARTVYRILYENQHRPLTMAEIRRMAAPILAAEGLAGEQEQLDRRRRDLNPAFLIEKDRAGRDTRYRLVGSKDQPPSEASGISLRVRAQVLEAGRCAMCGRTPAGHGVVLVVDHKIPQTWGGTNDPDNLQPLCEDCNAGKKDHFASFDRYSDKIRKAIRAGEPHRRIGELLKAFRGEPVRTDLIGIVASARQYQEDYQKRLRELRTLGWKIQSQRRKEGGRTWTYYRLIEWQPWPEGSIRAEISRRERLRSRRKGRG